MNTHKPKPEMKPSEQWSMTLLWTGFGALVFVLFCAVVFLIYWLLSIVRLGGG